MREVIKHAKLFEAGVYEDKGLEMTEEDIDELIEASGPVPLTIGHLDPETENPLRLGVVSGLYRKGKELFGVIRFVPEAWALAVKSGARWLSICLDMLRKRLVEVSLVTNPRVSDAKVKFDSSEPIEFTVPFDTTLDDRASVVRQSIYDAYGPDVWVSEVYDDSAIVERGGELWKVPYQLNADNVAVLSNPIPVERQYVPTKFNAQVVEALGREREAFRRVRRDRMEETILQWKRDGKLLPAGEKTARRILFGPADGAELFQKFLDDQPAGLLLREVVPFHGESLDGLPELDASEASFCDRSGIPLDEYRRMKAGPPKRRR